MICKGEEVVLNTEMDQTAQQDNSTTFAVFFVLGYYVKYYDY